MDAGCGTGDNATFFARRGQTVLGIDFVAPPIQEANRKAEVLGVDVAFEQMEALSLKDLDRRFDRVIDCGLFHVQTAQRHP
ncbi:MAG: class I SAM-dependent methyltransferase [Planctomycetota bacterium]